MIVVLVVIHDEVLEVWPQTRVKALGGPLHSLLDRERAHSNEYTQVNNPQAQLGRKNRRIFVYQSLYSDKMSKTSLFTSR